MAAKKASQIPTRRDLYQLPGELTGEMRCCGLTEYDGVSGLQTVQEARNIRYAGYHIAENRGFVLATGIKGHNKKQMALLTRAGFKKMKTFKNPRTGNTIVLFGATTLKRDLRHSDIEDEDGFYNNGVYNTW